MTPKQRTEQAFELYRVLVLDEHTTGVTALGEDVADLVKIAARMSKRNVDACNWGLTPRQEKNDERDQQRATAILERWNKGYRAHFNGDPRGYALYIRGFTSGRSNSWGGASHGWGIG